MILFRVFPYDAGAAPDQPGGALFVPTGTGAGRIDNPDLYDVMYVAESAAAAVAETFGRLAVWRGSTFTHAIGLRYALGAYTLPDGVRLFGLDDLDALRSIGVAHPSEVVTRDRMKTQAWARTIFSRSGFAGIRWWSYYNPDWSVAGMWDVRRLRVAAAPEPLSPDHGAVRDAASAIVRQVAP